MAGIGEMARGVSSSAMATSMAQQPVDDGEQANVSPEEQAAYDQFVANSLRIMYPDGEAEGTVSPNILTGLSSTPENPLMALATTAVAVVTGLRDSAKKAGQPVPDEILYHGGAAVIEELAEIGEAAGIFELSEDDVEQSWYAALDLYRTGGEQTGDVDKEQLTQGWEAIKQADAQGRIGDVLPGIESRMKQGGR